MTTYIMDTCAEVEAREKATEEFKRSVSEMRLPSHLFVPGSVSPTRDVEAEWENIQPNNKIIGLYKPEISNN